MLQLKIKKNKKSWFPLFETTVFFSLQKKKANFRDFHSFSKTKYPKKIFERS